MNKFKLYMINNICVSLTPIIGSIEIKVESYSNNDPELYLYKRIIKDEIGGNIEVPSKEELNTALTIYNALKESASKDVYLLELEQRLTTLELKGMI